MSDIRALKRIIQLTSEYADEHERGQVALGAYHACSQVRKIAQRLVARAAKIGNANGEK
jgi:hypothetical protein